MVDSQRVTYDSGSSGVGSLSFAAGGNVNASCTHVVASATNRVAVVLGKYHDSSSTASGSISIAATFGGQSMTALGSVMNNNGTGDKSTLFYLLDPPTGSQTATVSCTSPQVDRGCIVLSMVFSGVRSVLGSLATSFGSGSSQSITYPSYANALTINTFSYTAAGGSSFSAANFQSRTEGTRQSLMLSEGGRESFTQSTTTTNINAWGAMGISLAGDSPAFFSMM